MRRRDDQPACAADQRHIQQQHHRRMPDHEVGRPGVAVRQPVKTAVEIAGEFVPAARDEIPACRWPLVLMRLQDLRGQRRRQGQRAETGDCGRHRDGDGELLEKLTGDAAEKCGRHEHRAQHQRDRDQCAANLLHRLERRVTPAHAVLEMPLDVFHHHDRVVDHDADREHEPEQGQVVDRESERRHHGKGADQRYRNGDDGNDRRPPALQEHQHDDDDEQHRLVDRLDQFVDGLRDEFGRVVADVVIEALWKTGLQLHHRVGNAFRGRQRVRAGPLGHQQRDR